MFCLYFGLKYDKERERERAVFHMGNLSIVIKQQKFTFIIFVVVVFKHNLFFI